MRAVIVERAIIDGEPIRAVSYLEPEHDWDSGFAVWATPPDGTDGAGSELVHLDCFIDEHPEAGQGMDLAREHGEAIRDSSGWIHTLKRTCKFRRQNMSI